MHAIRQAAETAAVFLLSLAAIGLANTYINWTDYRERRLRRDQDGHLTTEPA